MMRSNKKEKDELHVIDETISEIADIKQSEDTKREKKNHITHNDNCFSSFLFYCLVFYQCGLNGVGKVYDIARRNMITVKVSVNLYIYIYIKNV